MTWLGALLPAAQGVAAYAALSSHADTHRGDGDLRSRGQVMADTLVERLTGQATATAVPGPLPAPLVRNWLRGQPNTTNTSDGGSGGSDALPASVVHATTWLRRLFTAPDTGALVAMDSRRRCFDGQLRRFLITADRRCRTPWCDAPIRHLDHPTPVAEDANTTADNSQGLCQACNHTKETPGWTSIAHPGRIVQIITPTGHHHTPADHHHQSATTARSDAPHPQRRPVKTTSPAISYGYRPLARLHALGGVRRTTSGIRTAGL